MLPLLGLHAGSKQAGTVAARWQMAQARPRRTEKPLPPLDPQALQAIAVRYVERFQTTRARLVRLLRQKVRQRGWADGLPPPDPEAVADRLAALGYVDDAAFAAARVPLEPRPELPFRGGWFLFLAYELRGEPVPILHGFPVRAAFPGLPGFYWVKWLVKIEVK